VFWVPSDDSCGLRLSLCSRCLVLFPKAGDCLCVLASRCQVMFPVAGEEVIVFVFLVPSAVS
jgi:hypothetical protein